jgi:uncharacterized protein YndB with AHSA1/START domain
MSDIAAALASDPRDLSIRIRIAASRDKVWRCWTEGPLLEQWFTPAPWTTPKAVVDARTGGKSFILMRGPDGTEVENHGVYLEVVPKQRLVFTDAYTDTEDWTPGAKPFITAILNFSDVGVDGTLYEARGRHWSMEDRTAHAEMGFEPGWTAAAQQLEALAQTL